MSESKILLPVELTIVQAEDVRNHILIEVEQHEEIHFDDSELVRIDTIGLQLLLASVIHIKSKNKALHWHCQSNVIKESIKQLGIDEPILNQYLHF
jgi:anti-anti-sigma regulatory factor